MKIRLYSHCVDIGCGKDIMTEQVDLLERCGLLKSCDRATFCLHYSVKNYISIMDKIMTNNTNVKFLHFNESFQPWYEMTTIGKIQNDLTDMEDDTYVCLITHKGASHGPGGHQNWRKFMQYYVIEKWRDCVQKLNEGYDTVGAAYLPDPPYAFYPGTFWWAKAGYLKTCKKLLTPEETNFKPQFEGQPHHRYDAECWIGSGINPVWYEMNQGPSGRWYAPQETYRTDKFYYAS